MRSSILSISSLLLLAIQTNAQQQPAVNVEVNANPTVSINTSTIKSIRTNVNVNTTVDVQDEVDPSKIKKFTKSFVIDKNDKLNISNMYGSIIIKTWDKNEIKVDADIKSYAKTDEEAQKLLDDVSINATKNGDLVSIKTNLANRNGNWGRNVKNGKTVWRREVKTHYIVYMPASNALTAAQSYGDITIDDFSGPTSLKIQYGNLMAGDLRNANNYISVQYGKANLKNVNEARIDHQYGGGLTLGNINNLELEAQYTAVNIGTIKNNANIKHQYGSGVVINYAGSLSLTAQYTNIKVDKLGGTFTGTVVYGKLDVGNVESGCKVFNGSSDYSSITLGFSPSYSGQFNVTTNYGGFKAGPNIKVEKSDKGTTSRSYAGQIGSGGAGKVGISSNYGSITFK